MVRRPERELIAIAKIDRDDILTQPPHRLARVIPTDPRVAFRSSLGTIAETMLELCSDPATPWPLLVTTADHALLDPATVDEFSIAAGTADLAVGVVERGTLMGRFPSAERTWLRFRGGAYTGANLFVL
jgi:hypothetical protein